MRFLFTNSGPNASSITDIYFDDGTLLGIATLEESPGVDFTQNDLSVVSPKNLPGGNAVGFKATAAFSLDSDSPISAKGVNPGETLGVVIELINGKTFDDVLAALAMTLSVEGSLGIGIHVQAFEGGGSESFVTDNVIPPVPEPTTMLIWSGLGIAVGGFGVIRRRRLSA